MVITASVVLAVLMQQDTSQALSARARALLGRFPTPRPGEVSVATRFSTDTAWLGEQVELVTAAWFPRELRDRLRRPPTLRSPSLSGLWSVQSQSTPALAATRLVGGQIYDMFVAHQTIFPLGEGTIESPPATLSYAVPASVSFFAPEQRRTLSSRTVRLIVRAVPPELARITGAGPTARGLRLAWRAPVEGVRSGTPAMVELVVNGTGNITLWPAPSIAWPAGLRVYPERTDERGTNTAGRLGGEKRFRYTIVPDSEGVVTLPRVRYPYFDPDAVQAHVAAASPLALPVLRTSRAADGRTRLPITAVGSSPLASRVVRDWWGLLLVLAVLPAAVTILAGRRRPNTVPSQAADPEAELRRLLGAPVDAGPDRVAATLRRRGIGRDDADHVRAWLVALVRRRYGPGVASDSPTPPGTLPRILAALRRATMVIALVIVPLRVGGQEHDAVARYRAGDYAGAARIFADATVAHPASDGAWGNHAAALWMAGDEVGAAAGWLRALALAPRDAITRDAWLMATSVPSDVRALAPTVPMSRDELVLSAVLAWIVAWYAFARRHRSLFVTCVIIVSATGATAAWRWRVESAPRALVRGGAQLRVSPHPSAPIVGDAAAWTRADVERSAPGWSLIRLNDGRRGWVPGGSIAPLASNAH